MACHTICTPAPAYARGGLGRIPRSLLHRLDAHGFQCPGETFGTVLIQFGQDVAVTGQCLVLGFTDVVTGVRVYGDVHRAALEGDLDTGDRTRAVGRVGPLQLGEDLHQQLVGAGLAVCQHLAQALVGLVAAHHLRLPFGRSALEYSWRPSVEACSRKSTTLRQGKRTMRPLRNTGNPGVLLQRSNVERLMPRNTAISSGSSSGVLGSGAVIASAATLMGCVLPFLALDLPWRPPAFRPAALASNDEMATSADLSQRQTDEGRPGVSREDGFKESGL